MRSLKRLGLPVIALFALAQAAVFAQVSVSIGAAASGANPAGAPVLIGGIGADGKVHTVLVGNDGTMSGGGGGGGGGGGAVTVADGADVTLGAKADAAYTSGSGSNIAILKGIFGRVNGLGLDSSLQSLITLLTTTNSTLSTGNTSTASIATNTSNTASSASTIATNTGNTATNVNTVNTTISGVQGTPGSAAPSKGVMVGGKDGSGNFQPDSVDSSGRKNVNVIALPAIPAGTNTIGNAGTIPSAAGGVSTYSFQGGTGNAALTSTVVQVGTTAAHSLYGVEFVNTGSATAYVQVFDLASGSVTLGTTVPKWFFWIPAGGAYEVKYAGENRILFSTAMSFAATTTVNGNTAPSTAVIGNVEYL